MRYLSAIIMTCLLTTPAFADKPAATAAEVEESVVKLGDEATRQVLDALDALPYWAPLYPGAKASMTSAVQKTSDSVTSLVSFETKEDVQQVVRFYASQLAQAKLGAVQQSEGPGLYTLYVEGQSAKETCEVTVTTSEDGLPSSVSINYYRSF